MHKEFPFFPSDPDEETNWMYYKLENLKRLNTICLQCGSTKVQFTAIDSLVGPPYHPVCQDCKNKWIYIPTTSLTQPSKHIFIRRFIRRICRGNKPFLTY